MKKEIKTHTGKPITSLNHKQRISKRLEELEKIAKRNRDKSDEQLLDWLNDEEQEEYNRLIQEWNNDK